MKLTSSNETLAENKALILYILEKIGSPISNNYLFELVISIENMNYFYFQQFLLDLIDNKYILSFDKDNQTYYELTELGQETLELVKDLIPGILKFKVDNNFKENLHNIEENYSVTSDFLPNHDSGYIVSCKINENNENIFDIKILAGSREQAKFIADNWEKNAVNIYPTILGIMTKE